MYFKYFFRVFLNKGNMTWVYRSMSYSKDFSILEDNGTKTCSNWRIVYLYFCKAILKIENCVT